MPKTTPRLRMGEQYDKEALDHLNRTIEFEEIAAQSTVPADRERYGEKARHERDAAIEALEQAKIASGSESEGLRNTSYEFPT
jgi:hypothetical protein